jgi:thiamine pyrophosphate-dependent acetolactate synthase large subunit-like protein
LSADLVILIGQYCMPNAGEYAFDPEALMIRIDPDPADIGRNLPVDLGIVAGERAALEDLAGVLPARRREPWVAELAAARAAFERENDEYYRLGREHSASTSLVHPAVIANELAQFLHRGKLPPEQTTVVSGGYGIARYTRRYLRAYRPAQILNGAYQYGAIGPDVGYAVGAGAAVQQGTGPQRAVQGAPVVAITGDAGMGYSGMEIETLAKYRLPTVLIVYNNNAWGTFPAARRSIRSMHMYLFQEDLRYEKIGEALGARGEYVLRAEDFLPALERCYDIAVRERLSTVINCQATKDFWSNAYPPGMPRKVEPGCMSYYH